MIPLISDEAIEAAGRVLVDGLHERQDLSHRTAAGLLDRFRTDVLNRHIAGHKAPHQHLPDGIELELVGGEDADRPRLTVVGDVGKQALEVIAIGDLAPCLVQGVVNLLRIASPVVMSKDCVLAIALLSSARPLIVWRWWLGFRGPIDGEPRGSVATPRPPRRASTCEVPAAVSLTGALAHLVHPPLEPFTRAALLAPPCSELGEEPQVVGEKVTDVVHLVDGHRHPLDPHSGRESRVPRGVIAGVAQ